jgi:hypothetical protein
MNTSIALFMTLAHVVEAPSLAQVTNPQVVSLDTVRDEIREMRKFNPQKDQSLLSISEDEFTSKEIAGAAEALEAINTRDEVTLGILQRSMPEFWSQSTKKPAPEFKTNLSACLKLAEAQAQLLALLELKAGQQQSRSANFKLSPTVSIAKCFVYTGAQRDYIEFLSKKLEKQKQ